jgi:hypothetical protein
VDPGRIHIRRGERVVINGIQGQGKSNLLAWLIEPQPSAVIFDPKGLAEEWTSWGARHGYVVTSDPAAISRQPKVVYLVDQLALEDRAGWSRPGSTGYSWSEALRRTFERGNTDIVFEESLQLLPANGPHPQARRIILQSRGPGSTLWYLIQRPINFDLMALRTAEHVFSAAIFNGEDLTLLRKERGADPSPLTQLQDGKLTGHYEFSYHRLGSREWSDPIEVEQVLGLKKGVDSSVAEPVSEIAKPR